MSQIQVDSSGSAGLPEAGIEGTVDNMLHKHQLARASGPLAPAAAPADAAKQEGATAGGSLLHRAVDTAGNAGGTAGEGTAATAGSVGNGAGAGADAAKAESLNLSIPADLQNSISPEQVQAFTQYAAAMGWNNTQAQAALDYQVQNGRAAQSVHEKQLGQWEDSVRADPQLGGANLGTTVATANKAMQYFDPSGTISALLKASGQGSNPDVVRFLYKVGMALGEDRVPLAGNAQRSSVPLAQRMYPHFKF